MNTIKIISTVCLGIVLGLLVPDREKEQLKLENHESKIHLEEANLITEKLQEQDNKPGGFVLLSEEVTLITLKGFEGEIIWYQTHDLERLRSDYTGINFYPIKTEKIIEEKHFSVPQNARAFLIKGKLTDENYSIAYSY